MCSQHDDPTGRDLEWVTQPYRVTLIDDDGGHLAVIVDAIGPNDARNLGRERALDLGYPGPAVVKIEPLNAKEAA